MSFPVYDLSDSDSDSIKNTDDEECILFDIPSISSYTFTRKSPPKPKPSMKTVNHKAKCSKKTVDEKMKLQEEKLKLKEEKRKILEEKEKLKAEKKKKAEMLKQLEPGECIKFIIAFIDSSLLNQKFGGELLTALRNANIKYMVREQTIPKTVSWTRNINQCDLNVDEHIVVIWLWEEVINLIVSNTLNDTINELITRHPNYKITIVVFGIEEYFRTKKNARNKEFKSNVAFSQNNKTDVLLDNYFNLSRIDVEAALAGLQLMLNVQYRFIESIEEMGLFISQFSKAVAELPYKLRRNKNQDSIDWFAAADSKECVRVDASGNGLSQLWQQQLCQFPNVGLDVAQAITSEYRSPRVLMESYSKCLTKKEGELLLQNIQIRRGQGPLTSVRRVGPELSKKIYNFFTATDGNFPLSPEN